MSNPISKEEYSTRAIALAREGDLGARMINGALGLSGEAGEVADIIKKVLFHDKPMDRQHLLEELGDTLWYMNLLILTMGSTWDEVMAMNIAKLETRFPDKKFNVEHVNNRDLGAEAKAMQEAV